MKKKVVLLEKIRKNNENKHKREKIECFLLFFNTNINQTSKQTPRMIEEKEYDLFMGENRNYYYYDGELYTKTFPLIWARTHFDGTGPTSCKYCKQNGSWNGVFVAYCCKCAEIYKFTRGYGIRHGIHRGEDNIYPCSDNYENSVTNTYMKGICIDKIGDRMHFVDSAGMHRIDSTNVTMDKIAEKNKVEYLEKLDRDLEQAWQLQVTWGKIKKQMEKNDCIFDF